MGKKKGGEGAGDPTWEQLADMWYKENGEDLGAACLSAFWRQQHAGVAGKDKKAEQQKASYTAKKAAKPVKAAKGG